MTYNFCQKCCTRFEACETCRDAELAAKDKEIARLRAALEVISNTYCIVEGMGAEAKNCNCCIARAALKEPT
jgi:hypothetical protein